MRRNIDFPSWTNNTRVFKYKRHCGIPWRNSSWLSSWKCNSLVLATLLACSLLYYRLIHLILIGTTHRLYNLHGTFIQENMKCITIAYVPEILLNSSFFTTPFSLLNSEYSIHFYIYRGYSSILILNHFWWAQTRTCNLLLHQQFVTFFTN